MDRTRKGLLIPLFLLFVPSVFSQTQFVRALGGRDYDIAHSLIQTRDGGYTVAGWTNSFGAGLADVLLTKFDSSGNHQWTRTLGGTGDDIAHSLIQTVDGGYAISGETRSFGAGSADVLLAKFDSLGNHQWTKTLGGTSDDIAYSLIQDTNGEYVVAGQTHSFVADSGDVFLAKFDSSGNHQWTKTLGGVDDDVAYSLIQTEDGGYAVAGETGSFGAEYMDVLLAKFDSSGNYQWTRTLGGASDDIAYSLVQTGDGGYAIAGETFSFGALNYDLLLAKLDSSGGLQWTRTLGGTNVDRAYSLIQTRDGEYTVAGWSWSFGSSCQEVLLAKFDSSGSHQWARILGGINIERAHSLLQTPDGSYVIAGETKSFGAGLYDFLLAKFDTSGNSCLGDSINPSIDTVYPSIDTVIPSLSSVSPTVIDTLPTITNPQPTTTIICENAEFIRGDANGDMVETVADAIYIISYIYRGGPCVCQDCADTNDDGKITSADAVYAVSYIYRSGPPPPHPFPDCSVDLTPDGLGCNTHPCGEMR